MTPGPSQQPAHVLDFICDCIEQAGGAVEVRTSNLMDAILPPSLEEIYGGKPLVTLALDTDALDVAPQAEMATVGSPIVEALIAVAAQRGTTTEGHIVADRLRKKDLMEEVGRVLILSDCRLRFDESSPEVLTCHYAQFNFKVTYLSDERRERLYVLPVNLWSNQVNLLLAERLPTLPIAADRAQWFADAQRVSVEAAYESACQALRRLVELEAAQHQARISKRFEVECARITDYYSQMTEELQRRMKREEDEKRMQTLIQKMETARLEGEKKSRELGEKYRLRLRAQLTSARLLSQPKLFFKLLLDRGQTTRSLTLAYDTVLSRLEPPACEACGGETTRLHFSPQARLLCQTCAEGG